MELAKYKACIYEDGDYRYIAGARSADFCQRGNAGRTGAALSEPSEFCKEDLKMPNVKSYSFVKAYFSDSEMLVAAIKKYHEISRIPKGEYTLMDLLK